MTDFYAIQHRAIQTAFELTKCADAIGKLESSQIISQPNGNDTKNAAAIHEDLTTECLQKEHLAKTNIRNGIKLLVLTPGTRIKGLEPYLSHVPNTEEIAKKHAEMIALSQEITRLSELSAALELSLPMQFEALAKRKAAILKDKDSAQFCAEKEQEIESIKAAAQYSMIHAEISAWVCEQIVTHAENDVDKINTQIMFLALGGKFKSDAISKGQKQKIISKLNSAVESANALLQEGAHIAASAASHQTQYGRAMESALN